MASYVVMGWLVIAIACSGGESNNKAEKWSELEELLKKEIGYMFSKPEPFISLIADYLLFLDVDNLQEDDIVSKNRQFREILEDNWKDSRDPIVGVTIGVFELMAGILTSEKGMPYITEAADEGLAEAYLILGIAYADGEFGLIEDKAKASSYLKSAAEAGSIIGMISYGDFLQRADQEEPDYGAAVKWYRKAVEAGSPNGMISLGKMYRYGRGVIKDYKEFVRLVERAALSGGGDSAAFELALAFQYGHEVPEDIVKAYKWYNIASGMKPQNNIYRESRDKLERLMTEAQIEEAQELSREFFALPEVRLREAESEKLKRLLGGINVRQQNLGLGSITDDALQQTPEITNEDLQQIPEKSYRQEREELIKEIEAERNTNQ